MAAVAGDDDVAADDGDDLDVDEPDAVDGERGSYGLYALPPGADPSLDWGLTAHLDEHGRPRIIERTLVVRDELAGLRLDHFVKTQIERLSRTRIQQVIREQLTRTDGHRLKPATIVAEGERYLIRREARREPPCPRTFGVCHRDERVMIVNKPAGLPVHASAKFYFNTLVRVMAERFPDETGLQICHRLDRETSGCLVVARDREAASYLKQAFETKKKITKEYLAIVYGHPPWPATGQGEHVLDVPLRLSRPGDPTTLTHVRVIPGPGGLDAMTRVSVERQGETYALVRCILVTGRQHQIRVHLAHAGYPIVGDKLYAHGDDAFIAYCDHGLTPELAAMFVLPHHALHAAAIAIPHPDGGRVSTEAPLPAALAALVP
ncbi:MAG: RluA family pseudouridine synthase [Proteobacteria bacterium]|nr:RluA family pseudouridine synthase [Pseudomonadota bacterium]